MRSNSGCNCPDLTIGHPVGQTSWNNNCFNIITVLNNVYIYSDINFSLIYPGLYSIIQIGVIETPK